MSTTLTPEGVHVDYAPRDVQLRAADLEPFLRRARRIKLDALAPTSLANHEGDDR